MTSGVVRPRSHGAAETPPSMQGRRFRERLLVQGGRPGAPVIRGRARVGQGLTAPGPSLENQHTRPSSKQRVSGGRHWQLQPVRACSAVPSLDVTQHCWGRRRGRGQSGDRGWGFQCAVLEQGRGRGRERAHTRALVDGKGPPHRCPKPETVRASSTQRACLAGRHTGESPPQTCPWYPREPVILCVRMALRVAPLGLAVSGEGLRVAFVCSVSQGTEEGCRGHHLSLGHREPSPPSVSAVPAVSRLSCALAPSWAYEAPSAPSLPHFPGPSWLLLSCCHPQVPESWLPFVATTVCQVVGPSGAFLPCYFILCTASPAPARSGCNPWRCGAGG